MQIQIASSCISFALINRKISSLFLLIFLFSFTSITLQAKGPVKPLGQKALKKIEVEYDKETRALFSGKKSDKNVLALKRLIAEEIDPDLAISAIKKYEEARKLRSGSIQKREALNTVEQLFSESHLSSREGRDIIIGAGGSVSARKTKTVQKTYHRNNKPRCRSKKTGKERAPQVKHSDPDQLAEQVIVKELDGKTKQTLIASAL